MTGPAKEKPQWTKGDFILWYILVYPAFYPLIGLLEPDTWCRLFRVPGLFIDLPLFHHVDVRTVLAVLLMNIMLTLMGFLLWGWLRTVGVPFRWVWYPNLVLLFVAPVAMINLLPHNVMVGIAFVVFLLAQARVLQPFYPKAWLHVPAVLGGIGCAYALFYLIQWYGTYWMDCLGIFIVPAVTFLPSAWFFSRIQEEGRDPRNRRVAFYVHPVVLVSLLGLYAWSLGRAYPASFHALSARADHVIVDGIELHDMASITELRNIISPRLDSEYYAQQSGGRCMCSGGSDSMIFSIGDQAILYAYLAHRSFLRYSPSKKEAFDRSNNVDITNARYERLKAWLIARRRRMKQEGKGRI